MPLSVLRKYEWISLFYEAFLLKYRNINSPLTPTLDYMLEDITRRSKEKEEKYLKGFSNPKIRRHQMKSRIVKTRKRTLIKGKSPQGLFKSPPVLRFQTKLINDQKETKPETILFGIPSDSPVAKNKVQALNWFHQIPSWNRNSPFRESQAESISSDVLNGATPKNDEKFDSLKSIFKFDQADEKTRQTRRGTHSMKCQFIINSLSLEFT